MVGRVENFRIVIFKAGAKGGGGEERVLISNSGELSYRTGIGSLNRSKQRARAAYRGSWAAGKRGEEGRGDEL